MEDFKFDLGLNRQSSMCPSMRIEHPIDNVKMELNFNIEHNDFFSKLTCI